MKNVQGCAKDGDWISREATEREIEEQEQKF